MCTTKKVLRYEAGRDDRVLDISAFAYGGWKPCIHSENIKVTLASLACTDMASEHK